MSVPQSSGADDLADATLAEVTQGANAGTTPEHTLVEPSELFEATIASADQC